MEFAHVGPRDAGARAQLLTALLLVAMAPFYMGHHPIQTHALKLDLPSGSEEQAAAAAPPRAVRADLPPPPPDVPATGPDGLGVPSTPRYPWPPPLRRVVVTADGRILADGMLVDLIGLRRRLDLLYAEEDAPWAELRPDPNARYERFAEVLAIFKRAAVERVRLDNGRYEHILDESYGGSPRTDLHPEG
jgi:biopolymer transport protein ExbD